MAVIARRLTARGTGSSSASLWLRVRVWWRRRLLIEALLAGADPHDSAELTLIAGELIGRRARQQMADALDRVLGDAASRPTPGSAAVPLNRRGIIRARAELATVAVPPTTAKSGSSTPRTRRFHGPRLRGREEGVDPQDRSSPSSRRLAM
jgi:hypothetical protein